jgi:hypothetical protein
VEELLKKFEDLIITENVSDQSVSSGSVGWHIEHSLLTIDMIIYGLEQSDPKNYKWKFSLPRLIVHTTGIIPRGGARAPKIVQPSENYKNTSLHDHLTSTTEKLKVLKTLHRDSFFIHPFFGKLNLNPSKKFMKIHTRHHLKIINNIINKTRKG